MGDQYLYVEGLQGEALGAGREGWIEILSFSWGISSSIGGAATFNDFSIVKFIDRTSPDLALACAEGRVFPSMTVELASSASNSVSVAYRMSECLITGLTPGGSSSSGEGPLEQLSFSFAHIEWRYTPLNSDGSPLEPIARSFSLTRNTTALGSNLTFPTVSSLPSSVPQVQQFIRNTAFILMWMDPEVAELEDVHLTIKDVCKQFGIDAQRADDIQHDDRITEVILERLRTSEFIIADLTGARPNVYYEIGHAHAIGKRPILLRKKGSALHFDLSVHNAREYRNVTELREILVARFNVLMR